VGQQLEGENRRFKQVVADLTLDKAMLQDVLQKRPEAARRREMAGDLVAAFRVPTRRAWCGGPVQSRDLLLPFAAARRDAAADAAAAARRGPAAVRLSAAAHCSRREGWRSNHKKTYRLYRVKQLGVRVRRRHKHTAPVGTSSL
jgi:hypothetical protein